MIAEYQLGQKESQMELSSPSLNRNTFYSMMALFFALVNKNSKKSKRSNKKRAVSHQLCISGQMLA